MNQKTFTYGFTTVIAAVGAGVTAPAFVTPPPNCNLVQFQVPRTDIVLQPFRPGSTQTLADLVAGQSLGFPLATGPLYSFFGSPGFFLQTSGTAVNVPILFGLSQLGASFKFS